jgi:hypothetical protein
MVWIFCRIFCKKNLLNPVNQPAVQFFSQHRWSVALFFVSLTPDPSLPEAGGVLAWAAGGMLGWAADGVLGRAAGGVLGQAASGVLAREAGGVRARQAPRCWWLEAC